MMSANTARMGTPSQPTSLRQGRQPSRQQPPAVSRQKRPQPWSKPSASQLQSTEQTCRHSLRSQQHAIRTGSLPGADTAAAAGTDGQYDGPLPAAAADQGSQ